MKAKSTNLDNVVLITEKYGWTITYLNNTNYNHKNLLMWLNTNCKGKCRFYASAFTFQDPGDAIMFKLVNV